MSILQYIQQRIRKKESASVAKERLQIIISHERAQQKRNNPDYLPKLQQELLEVISKYININKEQVVVQLDRVGDHAVLELNVTIPDTATEKTSNTSTEGALA